MPFNFVNSLKDGKWTKHENKWLTDVKKTLKQAESSSIKDEKLVHTIMKSDLPFTESNLLNEDNDHIHQVTLDNESWSTFYVNDAQIVDVIVSNHGTKWEHRAKIVQTLDGGISVLVKLETSLKKEVVYLNDC